MPLKKDLTLGDLVFYGLGVIFGAGIYVLVGHAAGIAGNTVWLSFLIAAAVAALTGLSYAELSSMYPRDAAEYTYAKNAFKSKSIGFVAGWLMTVAVIIASATVALGFGKYVSTLTGFNPVIAAAILVVFLSAINFLGIKLSSRINIVLTLLTVLGLLIIIAIGVPHWGSVNYFESPAGLAGTLGAATLVFFAYLGFDEIVNVSEEAKNSRKNVPKAILISVLISTVVYVLVALSSVSTISWQVLGQSGTPLALVAGTVLGKSTGFMMSMFGIFATASSVLIFMLTGSRLLFGMSEVHAMPKSVSKLGKRKTPYISIAMVGIVSLLFVLLGDMTEIALIVDFSAFVVFATINLSAFALRFREPDTRRDFKVPLNLGRAPVLPLLGFIISCYMLTQFDISVAWIIVAIIAAGYSCHKYLEFRGRMHEKII